MTNWDKTRTEADIAEFKNLVEDAPIEVVDEPTGKQRVEIAWENAHDGFNVEEGIATGVYRGRNTVTIDWEDERGTITVRYDDIVTLETSGYFVE